MEKRIEALERANRQLRVAVVVLFVLSVARLIVPASAQSNVPDVVRAGKFEVVRNGKMMGYLGASEKGGRLDLRDTEDHVVVAADAVDAGGMLKIGNRKDKPLVMLGADDDATGLLNLGIGDGNAVVQLLTDSKTGGAMHLKAPDGGDGIWMHGRDTTGPSINMMDGCIQVLAPRGMKFSSCQ